MKRAKLVARKRFQLTRDEDGWYKLFLSKDKLKLENGIWFGTGTDIFSYSLIAPEEFNSILGGILQDTALPLKGGPVQVVLKLEVYND